MAWQDVDETVHKEKGDRVEMAATTTSSLEAEQDSGSGPRHQDTILGARPAQTRVLDLENVDDAQALEINKLKKKVKKVESRKKSRTLQLKRRLFKVRIKSSSDKNLGDQEDLSNLGRNDPDEGISFIQEDAETQGRHGQDTEVNTASIPITTASINNTTAEPVSTVSVQVTTVGVSVSTTEPSTPPTTTTLIEDEDLTIAQTIIKIRSVKSKEKSKERGVSSTRLTRGVIMNEASETTTSPTVPPQQQLDPKDKDKGKMVELEKPLKKKDQIALDEEVARKLEAQMQAELEKDRLARQKEEEANIALIES
uniref:Uncharacterized protein n=1 Tax=Tanacetum cinerariifolium TaxID=118510 RepID=A0A6L2M927_TANCI|nr:hypothetical protein [Tanacetum cinerariifolium]